jgi:hypothetical protein
VAHGLQYTTRVTATSSGGSVSFVSGSIPLKATRVEIVNTGASGEVFVNLISTTGATTGDWPIAAGTSATLVITAPRGGSFTGLSYVSSGAAAPSFRVLATRI